MPQYVPLGTVGTPASWTIPPSLELAVQAVFASFDGTSAAGSYLPTLQILSDSGHTVVEIPQDASVAAGSSVSASWGSFLRGATAAAASSVGIPYAQMSASSATFADTGFAVNTVSLSAGSFVTSDATVFATGTSGGFTGLQLTTTGQYLVSAAVLGSANAAPAAGSFVQTSVSGVLNSIVSEMRVGGWFLIDAFGDYQAAATRWIIINVQAPNNSPPVVVTMRAGQNSGLTVTMASYLTAIQLTTNTA